MAGWRAFSADGHDVRWATWDGEHTEHLTLRWENEAWTATGQVGRERVQYVLRLAPTWRVRQFLLFRDLDEPDLWLATDGHARWGEMNGAHRPELDGCTDIELACSPFPATLPIRRLPLEVGDAAELPVVTVDVETLAVGVVDAPLRAHRRPSLAAHRLTSDGDRVRRRRARRWSSTSPAASAASRDRQSARGEQVVEERPQLARPSPGRAGRARWPRSGSRAACRCRSGRCWLTTPWNGDRCGLGPQGVGELDLAERADAAGGDLVEDVRR